MLWGDVASTVSRLYRPDDDATSLASFTFESISSPLTLKVSPSAPVYAEAEVFAAARARQPIQPRQVDPQHVIRPEVLFQIKAQADQHQQIEYRFGRESRF